MATCIPILFLYLKPSATVLEAAFEKIFTQHR